jgi:lactoylglutathione lyase
LIIKLRSTVRRGQIIKTEFATVGIRVKDLQKSLDFYVKLLGMRIVGRGKLEQTKGEWVELASEKNGFTLELNYYERNSPYYAEYELGEALDHLTFKVEDLGEALKKAELAGHPKVDEQRQGSFRWAFVEDPNGIWVQLY